jgi:alkylated DNA repair dioxygenase AlkB
MCEYISQNIKVLEANSYFEYGDTQVEKAFSAASADITETLLDVVTPILSETINCELYPTYSYLRIYVKGAVLEKHQDRPSCEVSATVPLSYSSDNIWPLYIERGDKTISVELEPGDALIYKGIEIPHWRDAFEGERQVQVFLHYVKKHGDYSEYKFDKRPHLGHQRWGQVN